MVETPVLPSLERIATDILPEPRLHTHTRRFLSCLLAGSAVSILSCHSSLYTCLKAAYRLALQYRNLFNLSLIVGHSGGFQFFPIMENPGSHTFVQ